MGHVRLTLLLACATALVALAAPAIARAGVYTWSLPGDFSGASNPDQKYGQTSFGYDTGTQGTTLTPLPCGSGTCSDTSGDSISQASGQLAMTAAIGQFVTVVWTDPLGPSQPATVTYSESGCPLEFGVTDQSGNPVTSGSQVAGNIYVTAGGVLGCTADVSLTITATTPSVTITTPTNGSTFTTGQPEFAGTASTAFDASNGVAVSLYAGSSASGTPIETLGATVSSGTFTAVPTTPLPNGTYTAQAEQDDPAGTANHSAPVTFTLANTGPTLTLDSLGSKPLLTSTPTFTGTAGTRSVDTKSVAIPIWSGSSVTGQPVAEATGSVASSGKFSVQSPSLADGRYTAVVAQVGDGIVGFSTPVTFRVKVHGPALSIVFPSAGGSMRRSQIFFSGQAGDALGDNSTISFALFRGAKARGKAIGKRTIHVNGASWSIGWGVKLKNGFYTATATQSDDAGHTTRILHTFVVVPGPTTIGSAVSLSAAGRASVQVGCVSSAGSCSGTVLVVTTHKYRPTAGGPTGPIRLLFAYVQIPAEKMRTVNGTVPSAVARMLRSARASVRVTAVLSRTGSVSAIRSLKLNS